ncbi:hypothetical protein MML48_4g00010929 [Holotrichia oblita]|uniref:Uncharacterized protein n=1 Tax=Holotrichia oblita TaxID=644536 RepID=A0ACB9TB58_HOLOL|nr:hypothetical protein MML48_4g00010929 [Holotrichia oblita]
MGTNQSKKEEEIIIAQAGNSGGTTGLNQITLGLWEECTYGIRREITRSQELYNISVNNIETIIEQVRKILDDKLNININMAEDFCLKTAGSLLPSMDGTEETTKKLIDSIRLYADLLKTDHMKYLINYVLKTRLSENAKVRLNSKYDSIDLLLKDLRDNFVTVKSASTLSYQLHQAHQLNKSLDEFGSEVEQLLSNLTLAQANGNDEALQTLRPVNEQIAISSFCNGLKNHELRTIVKARNYIEILTKTTVDINSFNQSYAAQNNRSNNRNYRFHRSHHHNSGNFRNNNNQNSANTHRTMTKKCRGMWANWTQDMMEEALTLLRRGKSQRYVENKCGIPRRTFRNHMKTGDVQRKLGKKPILNPARAAKLNSYIVRDYFQKLNSILEKYSLKHHPSKIYNMDEKGCRLTLHHQQTVIAKKGNKRVHLVAPEHAENCTIVACANALGNSIPPMILFKGQRLKPTFGNGLPPGSRVAMSPKGSMTTSLFIEWLSHFSSFIQPPVLLIFDGAASHLDLIIVDTAERLGIHLLCLPSNTAHALQPLDKSFFRAFEHHWDEEIGK